MDDGTHVNDNRHLLLPSTELYIPRLARVTYERPLFNTMVHLNRSQAVDAFMRQSFPDVDLMYKEYFWVLCLNSANRLLSISLTGIGHDGGVLVSPKEILQLALLTHANGVILVHNHPSGNRTPSSGDLDLTASISKTLNCINVTLLDHLILTQEGYFSMADEGKIS